MSVSMDLQIAESPPDTPAQRSADRARFRRAFNASLGFVLLLSVVFALQQVVDLHWLAIAPRTLHGLAGVIGAPLLHGSPQHLLGNAVSLLMLGTLAGTVYPRTTPRALPLLWLGSGVGAWLLGQPGTLHLGASGLGHGLLFLLVALAALRRDRAAVATAMIAAMFYGGMLLTILPREPDVSWQAHMGGAAAGLVAAWLWRHADPRPPRRRYSWEIEAEAAAGAAGDSPNA